MFGVCKEGDRWEEREKLDVGVSSEREGDGGTKKLSRACCRCRERIEDGRKEQC